MTGAAKPHLSRAHLLDHLRTMIRIRRFEDRCAELYTREKIRGFLHLYDGEEAVAAGIIPLLGPADRIVATYREHGHALARGVPMDAVMAEMFVRWHGSVVSRAATIALGRAFFEPRTSMAPATGCPPRTSIVSEADPEGSEESAEEVMRTRC